MSAKGELPMLAFGSRDAWEAWLAKEHETSPGVWMKIARKGSGIETVSQSAALEVALCYGWIDGQKRRFDDDRWLQRFTPRARRSAWSKINRDKVTELIERGAMKPAGLAQVERAQADGRWDAAYDGPATATMPSDFARALQDDDTARTFFEALDGRNRYAILYRIQDAKKAETRAARIEKYVSMMSEQTKIYP
jgi:uncharacterized protein YdeI (YjbR/CyaY-like superfamily)